MENSERWKKIIEEARDLVKELNLGPNMNPSKLLQKNGNFSERKCHYYNWRLWSGVAIGLKKFTSANLYYCANDDCPACHYVPRVDNRTKNWSSCVLCISKRVWDIGVSEEDIQEYGTDCDHEGSPFTMWQDSKLNYDICFFAQIIADESKELMMENL